MHKKPIQNVTKLMCSCWVAQSEDWSCSVLWWYSNGNFVRWRQQREHTGWVLSCSIIWALQTVHFTDALQMVPVMWAFMSWAVLNYASLWCFYCSFVNTNVNIIQSLFMCQDNPVIENVCIIFKSHEQSKEYLRGQPSNQWTTNNGLQILKHFLKKFYISTLWSLFTLISTEVNMVFFMMQHAFSDHIL